MARVLTLGASSGYQARQTDLKELLIQVLIEEKNNPNSELLNLLMPLLRQAMEKIADAEIEKVLE